MSDPSSRSGASYSTPEISQWLSDLHAPHDESLARAYEAPLKHGMPPIQISRDEGKLLEWLVRLVRAVRVVEIGTLAGYSAIRIARALPEAGKLWTIECSPRHAAVARENLEAAGVASRVEVLVGEGAAVLPTLEAMGPFDAVFIDADKENYDVYGRWAAANLRPSGLIVADNTFYFGRLLEEHDRGAIAMRRFHEHVAAEFHTAHIGTADGQLLGIRR